MYFFYCKT